METSKHISFLRLVEEYPLEVVSQMHISKRMLEVVRRYSACSVIMGGAPRDWWSGNLARDVDIFIYERGGLRHAAEYETVFGVDNLVLLGNEEFLPYEGNNGIRGVYEGTWLGVKFQFIMCRVIPSWQRFPISLSRYMFDLSTLENSAWLHRTLGAAVGEQEKKIFCRERDFTAGEIRYLHKVWNKVPEYEILTDTEGLELAKERGYAPPEQRSLD